METYPKELNEEQIKLFTILTPLQQRMVVNVERGMAPVSAYRAAGGSATTPASENASAANLLNNSAVRAFRQSLNKQIVNDLIMSRDEMRVRLTAIARGNITDLARVERVLVSINEDTGEELYEHRVAYEPFETASPDALAGLSEIAQTEHGIKLKMHSAAAAIKQLAELEGFNAPQQQEVKIVGGAVVAITATDPATAAKEYLEIMK